MKLSKKHLKLLRQNIGIMSMSKIFYINLDMIVRSLKLLPRIYIIQKLNDENILPKVYGKKKS